MRSGSPRVYNNDDDDAAKAVDFKERFWREREGNMKNGSVG